ncbi:Precorrin-2 C(20)-methyltransferase [Candidatus Hodgkinia cicadicola]|uniref:Precorrin-2 C(20)-methyltransferase n=1 Tax=Candidatus Hodgkinia cicadicola TaxID=573658 RepID=A0ABX4MHV6_9HYPH|nr:Precorrin-2 C(20)-methyltransferase [Candidatus Hodgkinia cicadicola]
MIYTNNHSLARSMIKLPNNKRIEMPIYSCFGWNDITENWKVCICYLLNLGYNINFISVGDPRLFCSVMQIFQDLMYYYPFTSSMAMPSTSVMANNYSVCLTSSNAQQLNLDLLFGFLNNPILLLLKLNIKFLSLIEIALIKLYKTGFKVQFINTSSERVLNSKRISGYFTMMVLLKY